MSDTSDDYERFIASLIRNLESTNRRISQLGFGRNNTIRGVSGQEHQVDVSFIDSSFPAPTLVIIECKRINKLVELGHVKIVKATIDDILADKDSPNLANGMIVTTIGAQEGARRFADFYDIKIESVPHGPNYTFRYEDVVQAGISMYIKGSVDVVAVLDRTCQSCGKRFRVVGNERICPDCTQAAGKSQPPNPLLGP